MSDLRINHDRRVADVQTVYDPVNGDFNSLFATAIPLFKTIYDGSGHPPLKPRNGDPFLVEDIFTDFKSEAGGAGFGWAAEFLKSLIPFPPDERPQASIRGIGVPPVSLSSGITASS